MYSVAFTITVHKHKCESYFLTQYCDIFLSLSYLSSNYPIIDPVVDYWLGGTTTLDATGTFRWDSTGAEVPMGVPFWFPGQPDFPVIERSLSLSKNGYFADEKEEIAQRFICQLL